MAKRTRKVPKVLLGSTLLPASTLRPNVQPGMGAFLAKDKSLIALGERGRIGDSLDLDESLKPAFPQANRWDYIFSVPDADKLVALEPHTAKDSQIKVLVAKKKHAVEQLRNHLPPQYRISDWLWVSHGTTSFSRMESARRRLDQAGIEYVGGLLRSLGKAV